jgi:hypothetical protein
MEITSIGSNYYTVYLYCSAPPAEVIKSLLQTSTAKNSQRKVVRDASNNYHIVFSSGGEIFYRKNVSGTWQNPVKISSVNGSNDYPSITVGSTNQVLVTWQRNTGTNAYDIYFSMSTDGGSTWPTTNRYVLESLANTTVTAVPVITRNLDNSRTAVVYETSSGLKGKTTSTNVPLQLNWTTQQITNNSDISPTLNYVGSGAMILSAFRRQSNNHVYVKRQNGTDGAWSLDIDLSYYVPGSNYVDETPSITGIPGSSQVHIAWKRTTNGGISSTVTK